MKKSQTYCNTLRAKSSEKSLRGSFVVCTLWGQNLYEVSFEYLFLQGDFEDKFLTRLKSRLVRPSINCSEKATKI